MNSFKCTISFYDTKEIIIWFLSFYRKQFLHMLFSEMNTMQTRTLLILEGNSVETFISNMKQQVNFKIFYYWDFSEHFMICVYIYIYTHTHTYIYIYIT
jgi:hypothetical protein